MTPRTVPSFAARACGWLLPLLVVAACSPERHIVATMDPDAAAGASGMGNAVPEGPPQDSQPAPSSPQPKPAPDCATGCCDDGMKDGDETAIDCGGSCSPCDDGQPCTRSKDCKSKVCTKERCVAASCSDGVLNGTETDRDCGGPTCDGCAIGALCAVPSDCRSGVCDQEQGRCPLACERGFDECDGDLSDPCEVDLLTSAANCGACGNVCALPHASARCDGGSCAIDSCAEGYDDCDGDTANGCETSVYWSADHCGACDTKCADTLGPQSQCELGHCVFGACMQPTADCDGETANGCETMLTVDVNNCGRCGNSCEGAHAVSACRDGGCSVVSCEDGWADCDASADDGCEMDITTPFHCGSCGVACELGAECIDGECVATPCDGLCAATEAATVMKGQGYKVDNIGSGELCRELLGYDPAPSAPAFVCWNVESPRTAEVNGVAIPCDGVEHPIDAPLRKGGYCVHFTPGASDTAGFEFVPAVQ